MARGGLALILVGLALMVIAAPRFVRTGRLIDDQEVHSAGSVRAELALSAALKRVPVVWKRRRVGKATGSGLWPAR